MGLSPRLRDLALAALLFAATSATPEVFDDTAIARFDYPEWFKTTFFDLRDDLADARAAGSHGILLFFSTTGCSYCKQMLDSSFTDTGFTERLRQRYHVIGLEIFSDSEITDWTGHTGTLSDFAKAQGVQFSPTLLFLDLDGRRQLRLVGYHDTAFLHSALDYLDSGAAPAVSLRDWQRGPDGATASTGPAAPLLADTLFASPPHQLDRRHFAAQRPLLVLFDGSDCSRCSRFHRQVLGESSIRRTLQGFDVVRLDAGDEAARLVAPDGSVKTAAAWHRELGLARLPALVVFDEHGRHVLQTDALVLPGRFDRLLGYVRDRAYERGWTFQRYARNESIRQMREQRPAQVER